MYIQHSNYTYSMCLNEGRAWDGGFVFFPSLPNMTCLVSVIKATIGVQEMQLSNVGNNNQKKKKKEGEKAACAQDCGYSNADRN